jgi:ATP-dependent RNA helicase DHX37/DHR1
LIEDLEDEDLELGENQVDEDFDLESDSDYDSDLGFDEDELDDVKDGKCNLIISHMPPSGSPFDLFA